MVFTDAQRTTLAGMAAAKANGQPADSSQPPALDRNQGPAIRQDDLDFVQRPFNEAWKQAATIAADETRTLPYKGEQIQGLFKRAADEIRQRGQGTVESLTKEQAALQVKARVSVAPAADQAAQLIYTRDALAARWHTMTADQMYQDWQAALDAGDKITAKVYGDFAEPALRATLGVREDVPLTRIADLATKTEDLLASAEQKKALAEQATVAATIAAVQRIVSGRVARLEQARIVNGQLVDGAEADQAQNLRTRF
jgi:hypothetical protein